MTPRKPNIYKIIVIVIAIWFGTQSVLFALDALSPAFAPYLAPILLLCWLGAVFLGSMHYYKSTNKSKWRASIWLLVAWIIGGIATGVDTILQAASGDPQSYVRAFPVTSLFFGSVVFWLLYKANSKESEHKDLL